MATKWAVANTEFTSASTWNDGVAPVAGDLCYLNGHTVTGTTGFNIGNGTISNDVCPNTGVGGGYISLTSGPMIITANVVCRGGRIILTSGNAYFTLNGNIDSKNTTYVIYRPTMTNVANCTINGNIDSESQIFHNQSAAYNLTINGNAILKVTSYSRQVTNLTINGSLTLNDYVMNVLGNCSVIGVLNSNYTNLICTAGIFTINGRINYKGNKIGVVFDSMVVNNPDTFMWHDVTEPRVNPFIILTNGDLNNRQQYPAEDRVVEGTPYAFNQMVGTFAVDYPPETVVLKDYVYDGGNMTGTLDLPQVPTTSDIVNAIKNDSDLGGKIDTTNTNVGNISTAVTTIDGKVDIIDTNVDTLLSRLTSVLTQRLGQSVTVEILQQILVAHLND